MSKATVINHILTAMICLLLLSILFVAVFPIFTNDLYVTPKTANYGVVEAGTEAVSTLTVWNLHPWTVVVTGIHTGCGCTEAIGKRHTPFRMKPLEHFTLQAKVRTAGKVGKDKEAIYIFTDDNYRGTSCSVNGTIDENLPSTKRKLL